MKPTDTDAPLMLSVSGARGLVGKSMTPEVAREFAAAFGSVIRESHANTTPCLCLGRDGRGSGKELAEAASQSLAHTGCSVIDLGIVTTPTVGIMTRELGAHGGMVITASHNPIQWNGIKCLNHDGIAPPSNEAARIIERFQTKDFSFAPDDQHGQITKNDTGSRAHVDRVLALVDCEAIRKRAFNVVLDSVNASGAIPGRMLLEELGCTITHLNAEHTGIFAHNPEPIHDNLTDLMSAVRDTSGAVVGFAQDPDADRLAIVDGNGTYIGEEFTLVLAALRMLQTQGATTLVTNLSTSRMIDDLAARVPGASVLRTAVGEANVVEGMRSCGSPLGGEGNGGVIVPAIGWVRDSLVAMALVLELLATEENTLAGIVEQIPKYAMVKSKFDLSTIGGREVIDPALIQLKAHYQDAQLSDVDGLRIDLKSGWAHIRASNTEPILRIITEAATESEAEQLRQEIISASGLG